MSEQEGDWLSLEVLAQRLEALRRENEQMRSENEPKSRYGSRNSKGTPP